MSSMTCGQCGGGIGFHDYEGGTTHCRECGWEIPEDLKEFPICRTCGNVIDGARQGTEYCYQCAKSNVAIPFLYWAIKYKPECIEEYKKYMKDNPRAMLIWG